MRVRPMMALSTFFLASSVICGAPQDREIAADLAKVKGPRSMIWQECVGAGRVGEGLRDGWRRQLEICHRELGFKYLRMHGLFHDELGVFKEDAQGNPVYNWQYIDDVYDFLLDTGMKPFVELGFMPNALASGDATVFWWKGNITPPKDYAKWDALITAVVQHWTDRYGAEEVKTWRFEVWNEPNLPMFFKPGERNRRDAYWEMYEHTSKAVKAVDKAYVVGGPGSAGPAWIKDIISFCDQKKLPLDFVSFHSYGLSGNGSDLDQFGNRTLILSNDMRASARGATSQVPVVRKSPMPNLPIHITEWSASWSPRDPIHDSYFSAPYLLEQLRETEAMASMSYWTFTDVFEENGIQARPFHGGFGLISYQGVKKPSYWAYWCLAQLGATELQTSDEHSYVCTDGKGGVQILMWDLTDPIPTADKAHRESNQEVFFKDFPTKEKGKARVRLSGMQPGTYSMKRWGIGYKKNDPYTRYIEMGMPADLNRQAVKDLKELSSGKPEVQAEITVQNLYELELPIQENGVNLITLTPASGKR